MKAGWRFAARIVPFPPKPLQGSLSQLHAVATRSRSIRNETVSKFGLSRKPTEQPWVACAVGLSPSLKRSSRTEVVVHGSNTAGRKRFGLTL
jgi:hypothetical protein